MTRNGALLNWAIGIDMYTVMCIKLMTDFLKNPLFQKSTNFQKIKKNKKKKWYPIVVLHFLITKITEIDPVKCLFLT